MDDSLYRQMLLIRVLEEELQKLCDQGEAGDLHFNRGQEAIAVGVCAALRKTDYIVCHHRTIAHAVAKGVPLKPLVAELLGKATGICGGRAGEMHINDPEHRLMFSFQLVGTCLPVSAGLAWAAKYYLESNDIVAVFHGDAATSNGEWHEGLNLAVIQKVPLLLVCENNHLAGNVTPEYYIPLGISIRALAQGHGVDATWVDGNHVDDVARAVQWTSEKVRKTSQPHLLEMDTTRLSKHKQGQGDIRSKEELAELAKRDPLLYEERRLGIDTEVKAQLLADAQAMVSEAIQAARSTGVPVGVI